MDNKSKKACKIELWFEEAEKIEEKEKKILFQNRGILGKKKQWWKSEADYTDAGDCCDDGRAVAVGWGGGERGGVGAPGMNYDAWATAHQPACH